MKTEQEWMDKLINDPEFHNDFGEIRATDIAAIQADAQAHLLERIKVLESQLMEHENREASVCPEGVSFEQRIKALEGERYDFIQWFNRHCVTGDVKPFWMTLTQMADHAYERIAEKLDRADGELDLLRKALNHCASQKDQATAILRRNLRHIRADVNLKGTINQQRHDDYIEACRICGVEP